MAREMMGGAWLASLHGDRQTTLVNPTAIKVTIRTAARMSILSAGRQWRAGVVTVQAVKLGRARRNRAVRAIVTLCSM
jgi:hypothetical protein